MIVPMKKVSLIIMGDKKSETLKKLRKLGILHIESVEGSGKKLEELKAKVSLLENALFSISEKKNKKIKQADIDAAKAFSVSEEIVSLEEEKKLCTAEKINVSAELDRISGWGEIDPEKLGTLALKGVDIALYEMPAKEYENLGDGVKTLPLEKSKASVKFLLVRTETEEETEIIDSLKAYRFEMPETSTAEINRKLENLNNRIKEIDEKISSFADCAGGIGKAIKACEKEIEFEVYATGMADENLSDVTVSYFTGYVEEENLETDPALCAALWISGISELAVRCGQRRCPAADSHLYR